MFFKQGFLLKFQTKMSFVSLDKDHNLDFKKLTKYILKKKLELSCVEKLKLQDTLNKLRKFSHTSIQLPSSTKFRKLLQFRKYRLFTNIIFLLWFNEACWVKLSSLIQVNLGKMAVSRWNCEQRANRRLNSKSYGFYLNGKCKSC